MAKIQQKHMIQITITGNIDKDNLAKWMRVHADMEIAQTTTMLSNEKA